jgi:hypothetical protein
MGNLPCRRERYSQKRSKKSKLQGRHNCLAISLYTKELLVCILCLDSGICVLNALIEMRTAGEFGAIIIIHRESW